MQGVPLPQLLKYEKICTEISFASGATPEIAVFEPAILILVVFPAIVPATCVPWLQPSMPTQSSPESGAVELATPPGQRLVAP